MNALDKFINLSYKIIRPVIAMASSAGMILLAAMMFLTAADVILRYALNKPIMGSYEITQYMLALLVAMGLAYCAIEKEHVNIDIFISRLSIRTRAIIDSVTGLMGLIIIALMTWQTLVYINMLRKSGLVSTVLLIPVYPFVAVVALGLALYCVILILHFLEFLSEGVKG